MHADVSTLPPAPDGFRILREARGLSQQRLAELAGCSISLVRQFERGYRPDGGTAFRRVAAVLLADDTHDDAA